MTEQKEVLAAAQAALIDAFGPEEAAKHTVKVTSTPSHGLTPSDLNAIIKDVGGKQFVKTIGPKIKVGDEFESIGALANALENEGKLVVNPISEKKNTAQQRTSGDNFSLDDRWITKVPENEVINLNKSPRSLLAGCMDNPSSKDIEHQTDRLEETKKLVQSFRKHVSNYPKNLSYEGSVVLCSLIGLKQNNNFRLAGLPKVDQDLIFSQLPAPETWTGTFSFSVELDDQQDFKLKCEDISSNLTAPPREFNLRFFNSVIRPNTSSSDIPIEQDGNKVTVGSNLVLDQQRIQKLVGNAPPEKVKRDEEETPRRQTVSGRNAYELRADLISTSMELLMHNRGQFKITPDEVVSTAKILYSFVENRR